MKKKRILGTWLINEDGKRELYISCRRFAEVVGRSYETVLLWTRKKWLKGAKEFGDDKYTFCLLPLRRSLATYRKLLRDGVIYRARQK